MKYSCYNKYILRTPINNLQNIKHTDYSIDFFVNNKVFMEAISLASPLLFEICMKRVKTGFVNKKEDEELLLTLVKYYIRSSMRCTPFGLFAGVSVGEFNTEKSNIIISDISKHKTFSRLDMQYIGNIIAELEKNNEVRETIRYYVNNSAYFVANTIRYIEYTSGNSNNKKYKISSIEIDDYVQLILDNSKNGTTVGDLTYLFENVGISYDAATDYINQIIDSQLLTSELNPVITGEDPLEFLIKKLYKIKPIENRLFCALQRIKSMLANLDKYFIGERLNIYTEIIEEIKKVNIKFDKKYLFQTDLSISNINNTLNDSFADILEEGINLLNKLSANETSSNIKEFINVFYNRYQDAEIPLLHALDTDIGVGYIQNKSEDNTPLVDDLANINTNQDAFVNNVKFNKVERLLLKKYIESIKERRRIIEVFDEDVKEFKSNWNDLPITFSAMARIVWVEGKYKIILDSVGGSSAMNLFSRFSANDDELNNLTYKIAEYEEVLSKDSIVAEIVHLPENRVGNVLFHPTFRKFEIPYLSQSMLDKEKQIPLDDLMISIRNNKIILRSKKYNKEVKPYLSNAHNFEYKALPVYQFLAELQTQTLRDSIFFNWNFAKEIDFIPRITYKDIILSLACWRFNREEVNKILKLNDDKKILEYFTSLQIKKGIPNEVTISEGDNELYIDLRNITHLKILISLIKSSNSFILQEYLFDNNKSIVTDAYGKPYANEIIFSFYKNEK